MRAAPKASSLENRIFHAPVAVHFPGLNGVQVARDKRGLFEEINVRAPNFGYFRERWLNHAFIIRAPRHKQSFLSAPIPRSRESSVRFARDRVLNLRIFPTSAAIC